MVSDALNRRDTRRPAVLLAENGSDIVKYSETRLFRSLILAVATEEAPRSIDVQINVVGRERPQHERQFIYSLPKENVTDSEAELVGLARTIWRMQWRRLAPDETSSAMMLRFREALNVLSRRSPSTADRFAMTAGLLEASPTITRASRTERYAAFSSAIVAAAQETDRVAVVVASAAENIPLAGIVDSRLLPRLIVGPVSHFAGGTDSADVAVVAGYFGPHTLDAILRLRPSRVLWIVDPVEASAASYDAHVQAKTLDRVGLSDAAQSVSALRAAVQSAGAIQVHDDALERELFAEVPVLATSSRSNGDSSPVDVADLVTLGFSDGSTILSPSSLCFDVVRAGAPRPLVVSAGELEEGDQILIVRGDHQRTLSELLIEDMDAAELKDEAKSRAAWLSLCRSAAARLPMRPAGIAAQIRDAGGTATTMAVRSWLRDDEIATTPSDWTTFQAFANVLQIGLPPTVVRQLYDAIRRWRIAHRKRGRDVVRLLRSAWFGGLSVGEASRIAERWGLGVRDLIEGSRVLEVERVSKSIMEKGDVDA